MTDHSPPLYLLVEWSVMTNKEDGFEREIARMKERILERGGCRFMHIYFNRSEGRAHAVEQFRDARELFNHLGSVEDLMQDFYSTCSIARASVLGDVSPELDALFRQYEALFPNGEPLRAAPLVTVLPEVEAD